MLFSLLILFLLSYVHCIYYTLYFFLQKIFDLSSALYFLLLRFALQLKLYRTVYALYSILNYIKYLYAHFIFHSQYWRFFFCIFLCVFYALFYPILYCFFVYSVNSLVQSTFAKFVSICRVNLIFRRPVRKSLWNWFIPSICGLPNGGAKKINF